MSQALETPVLLVVFNRLENTLRVLEAIRAARPRRLYISADGPRADRPGEAERCQAVREAVTRAVDWDCDLRTRFLEANVGCGLGPSTAIGWLFEHEEQGIILEDDCLPQEGFFAFCEQMLERYAHDSRVMHVAATNHRLEGKGRPDGYFFSRLPGSWGWATWRRAWAFFDYDMASYPDFVARDDFRQAYPDPRWQAIMRRKFDKGYRKEIEGVWDYQWQYAVAANGGLAVAPHANMVRNIGFDGQASHTSQMPKPYGKVTFEPARFPLVHPGRVFPSLDADLELLRQWGALGPEPDPCRECLKRRLPEPLKRLARGLRKLTRR